MFKELSTTHDIAKFLIPVLVVILSTIFFFYTFIETGFTSNSSFNEIQDIAKIGTWKFNPTNGQLAWSQQMFSLFPEDEANGEPDFERHKSTIHPNDRDHWQTTVDKCNNDGVAYSMDFRVKCDETGHQYKWIKANGRTTRNLKGVIIELQGTCID